MRRFVVLFVLLSFTLCSLLRPTSARAEARSVYVVVVSPDATELDPAQLRAAIGAELQADAVAPEDARASSARGRIDVSVDRAAGQLVVAYDGGGEPLARRVPLPADARATSLAAVLLAGNLARDEAGELAAQLRKRNPAPPPPPTPEELQAARANETLRRMLRAGAARDRSVRVTTGWTAIGVGAAVMAGGAALGVAGARNPESLVLVGAPFVLFGALDLASPTRLEGLAEYHAHNSADGPPSWLGPTTEQMWKSEATKARQWRAKLLVGMLGMTAVGAATVALVGVTAPSAFTVHSSADVAGDILGISAVAGLYTWGFVTALSESSTEAGLREYEHAVGRPIQVTDVGLRLAPTQGGFTIGVGGKF